MRPDQVRLTRPELAVDWPFDENGSSKSQENAFWPRGLEAIIIYDGTIHCTGRNFSVRSFNLSLNRKTDSSSLTLDTIASGTIVSREDEGPFQLVGRVISGGPAEGFAAWKLDLSLTCETWPLRWVPQCRE